MKFLQSATRIAFVCALFINLAYAHNSIWTDVSLDDVAAKSSSPQPQLKLMPSSYRLLHLDSQALQNTLASNKKNISNRAPGIDIPLPEGGSIHLVLTEDEVMAPELAAQFPKIRSWRVDEKDNNGIYGAIDLTEQGFHAMLYLPDASRLFIDPRRSESDIFYISYLDKFYHPTEKTSHYCKLKDFWGVDNEGYAAKQKSLKTLATRTAGSIRTYRLAMAATGEYTAYHGGTVAGALSAIVTTVSRVNTIYERDLAIKFQLVANNQLLIHTDTTTYSNNDANKMLQENQTQIDQIIGKDNYDIGHVVSTAPGGVAFMYSACSNRYKAGGVTGSSIPETDAFDIDFVAHEIGHQFGANHTFNSETASCGFGNRNPVVAVEPGSGSTIMAYAGLCGDSNNLQLHSDAMFNIMSIVQINSFLDNPNQGGSCGVENSAPNQQPSVQAGKDYTIPANTAFELVGSGSDADGDTLSYSWEQIDAGAASDVNVVLTDNALFRTYLPKSSPERIFPPLDSLLNHVSRRGETLPDIARSLNFSLVVRDQKGGVNADEMVVEVVDSSGFKITSHKTTETLIANEPTTVGWDVAGTDSDPVNCSAVDILLSTDRGVSFRNVLSATPNDGEQTITIPSTIDNSTTARFKIKCTNNIFFAISDADLTTIAARGSDTVANNLLTPGSQTDKGGSGAFDWRMLLLGLLAYCRRFFSINEPHNRKTTSKTIST